MKYNLWYGATISIEQNAEIEDYNIIKLKAINNKDLFGGGITKIDGIYFLQ